MAVGVVEGGRSFSGLRPMRPSSDLAQVADLIEEAFGHELEPGGKEALQELRFMSYMGFLLWLLERISPEFRNTFSGFVWVENGQIVANVTVNRGKLASRRWLISNVAVQGAYRRQGLARQLMEATLDWARQQGGEWAVLQVRADNEPARRLYRGLGFEELTTTMELRLGKVRPVPIISTEGFTLHPYGYGEWIQEYRLVKAATSAGAQWIKSIREWDFRLGLGRRLWSAIGDFLSGRELYRLAVESQEGFIARLVIQVSGGEADHRLSLAVHPDYRGRLEEMLVTTALVILGNYPRRAVSVTQTTDHPQAIEVLKRYGFVEGRALTQMRLDLTRRW